MMKRILVIEDDKLVRDSVTLSLETAGYRVMGAATCYEGLQNHQNFCASVIITDVVTLDDEAEESLRQLRLVFPKVSLITLKGNMSSRDRSSKNMRQNIQPNRTLEKPFTVDELLETVQSVLGP